MDALDPKQRARRAKELHDQKRRLIAEWSNQKSIINGLTTELIAVSETVTTTAWIHPSLRDDSPLIDPTALLSIAKRRNDAITKLIGIDAKINAIHQELVG